MIALVTMDFNNVIRFVVGYVVYSNANIQSVVTNAYMIKS